MKVLFSVRTLYEFKSEESEALPFGKGEVLSVLDASIQWWLASKSDETTGYIPSNYVEIIAEDQVVEPSTAEGDCTKNSCRQAPQGQQKQPFANEAWFFGKMTRKESEDLLKNQGLHGDFLVRESESKVRHSVSVLMANTSFRSLNLSLVRDPCSLLISSFVYLLIVILSRKISTCALLCLL